MKDKLLYGDNVLLFSPELAKKIGLNESIILQQVHYWLKIYKKKETKDHFQDGKWWIFNTYSDWQKQFPFWSERTIKRAVIKLEKDKLLISGNYNKKKYDRTKWYTINYEAVENLVNSDSAILSQSKVSDWHDGIGQNEPTYTIDYTEISSEIYNIDNTESIPAEYSTDYEGVKLNEPDVEDVKSQWRWKNEKQYFDYVNKVLIKYIWNIAKRSRNNNESQQAFVNFWEVLIKEYFKNNRYKKGEFHPWYTEELLEKKINVFYEFGMNDERIVGSVNKKCFEKYMTRFFEIERLRGDYAFAVFANDRMLTGLYGDISQDYSVFEELKEEFV